MNNLAELITVNIDPAEVLNAWEEQKQRINFLPGDWRTEINIENFTDYYKNLLNQCIEEIKIKPKNVLIQIHEEKLIQEKYYLTFTHTDIDRLTCLTIPIIYNKLEPIRFYDKNIKIPPRGQPITEKPIQTSCYSDNHPTLVNVNNPHNVRVIDKNYTRILLQLSFDEKFDDIVFSNSNIWKHI